MNQLDLFLSEKTKIDQSIKDISEVPIYFGDKGQRRKDLNRTSDFIKKLRKGKYTVYSTGGTHLLPKYEGRKDFPYLVNNDTDKVLRPSFSRAVYPCYRLYDDDRQGCSIYSHRIFGMAFVYNDLPFDNYNLDHINEDKLDYAIDNLRWVSVSDNMKAIKNRASSKNSKFKIYSSENYV